MRDAISLESVPTEPSTNGNIPYAQTRIDVDHLLAQLPWAVRQCLILNRIMGYSVAETAAKLGTTETIVETLVQSGTSMISVLDL